MDWTPILTPYTNLIGPDGIPCVPSRNALLYRPERLGGGLINDTFSLGPQHILQRLHPIFEAAVNEDIHALTAVLRSSGVPVPFVQPTAQGALFVEIQGDRSQGGGVWRVLTKMPGEMIECVEEARYAHAAGEMLGLFYASLRDLKYTFKFSRPGAHDTTRHMTVLRDALQEHEDHRLIRLVDRLGEELFMRWDALPKTSDLPKRVVHGDPKITNLLFDETGEVSAVLDLDTMGWSTLDSELGDAMRSWCNTSDEGGQDPRFCLARFQAAMEGFWSSLRGWVTREEWESVVYGTERICLELSARFAADALYESYFGWNPEHFNTRGDHNVRRARTQLLLARDVERKRSDMLEIVRDLWTVG